MEKDRIELKANFPVSCEALYDAWLSSEKHTAFTGGGAEISQEEGKAFSAWDEYISGKNLELIPGKRILQSWRTVEFPSDAPDSLLEINLEANENGCTMTLKHWDIPPGDGEKYRSGWQEHYFDPMMDYFS